MSSTLHPGRIALPGSRSRRAPAAIRRPPRQAPTPARWATVGGRRHCRWCRGSSAPGGWPGSGAGGLGVAAEPRGSCDRRPGCCRVPRAHRPPCRGRHGLVGGRGRVSPGPPHLSSASEPSSSPGRACAGRLTTASRPPWPRSPPHPSRWPRASSRAANVVLGLLVASRPSAADRGRALIGALGYGLRSRCGRGHATLGAARGQLIFAIAPFVGAVIAWVVLGEPVTVAQLVALGLHSIGVAAVLNSSHLHEHRHMPVDHDHEHEHDDGHHDHVHPDVVLRHVRTSPPGAGPRSSPRAGPPSPPRPRLRTSQRSRGLRRLWRRGQVSGRGISTSHAEDFATPAISARSSIRAATNAANSVERCSVRRAAGFDAEVAPGRPSRDRG